MMHFSAYPYMAFTTYGNKSNLSLLCKSSNESVSKYKYLLSYFLLSNFALLAFKVYHVYILAT